MIKRDIAIRLSYIWNSRARDVNKIEVDRYLFRELNKFYPKYGTNSKYSLNYMVENQEHSVKREFFIEGNANTRTVSLTTLSLASSRSFTPSLSFL